MHLNCYKIQHDKHVLQCIIKKQNKIAKFVDVSSYNDASDIAFRMTQLCLSLINKLLKHPYAFKMSRHRRYVEKNASTLHCHATKSIFVI